MIGKQLRPLQIGKEKKKREKGGGKKRLGLNSNAAVAGFEGNRWKFQNGETSS